MKSNVIVIIACEKLCKGLRYAGQLEYFKGRKVDYIGFYLCGAADKDDVEAFIDNLTFNAEYSEAQREGFRKVLDFVESSDAESIDEELKLFVVRNMFRLEFNSWMYMTKLMNRNCYLVLPVAQGVEPPVLDKDI